MKRLLNTKNYFLLLLAAVIFQTNFNSCTTEPSVTKQKADSTYGGQYEARLSYAPNVPEEVNYGHPMKVVVHLNIIEKVMRLADGVTYDFWTFGGQVPGKFIRIHVGDEVEFHLSNDPNDKMPHSIDMHAVTGPGGGAEASMTAPGHTSIFSFKALEAGLFLYHCATAPVGMHIANGMYGLVLVEPREGLPHVDKEFYIMQSEVYTTGKYGDQGLQAFDMQKALLEQPNYVIFNGSVGSTIGANALHAKVGEKVRFYVGNAGPNFVSSFHIIGEIMDTVRIDGGTLENHNVQTTLIPSGGAEIVEFTCKVPGTYTIVDHSIFRAFNQGALAQLIVSGPEDSAIYSHKQQDIVYLPEGSILQSMSQPVQPAIEERTMEERLTLGKIRFESTCAACHMFNAQGVPGSFPPLAGSNFLMPRQDKGIQILLHGLTGEVTVNGNKFNGVMPQLGLSDDEIANVLTYVRNNFGNKDGLVTAKMVADYRKQGDKPAVTHPSKKKK
ncbi:MAG: copper-containing nitrite reductase [Bacteroidia bacterium]